MTEDKLPAASVPPTPNYREQGLFQRYNYERADGKPCDLEEQLFTLRFDKDNEWGAVCRATLRDFADRIEKMGYVQLAADLRARLDDVTAHITAPSATPHPAGRVEASASASVSAESKLGSESGLGSESVSGLLRALESEPEPEPERQEPER